MLNSSMNELRVLATLATMPFLESTELAELAALPSSTTADVLKRFHTKSLIEFVKHSRSENSRVRRWCLTRAGVERLAMLRMKGENGKDLILKFSVSAQERRYVLRRLDVAAVLYRVAREAASAYKESIEWKWSRAGGLEAMMRFPDGRSAGLSRIGSTHSGKAIKNRLITLTLMYERKEKCPTFLLVPSMVELERALNWFQGRDMPVFIAIEDEVMRLPPGSAIWHNLYEKRSLLQLGVWLSRTRASDIPRTRQPSTRRLTLPADELSSDVDELDMAACGLTVPARRILRLLYDWPFIRVSQLETLMNVSEGHLRREKALLSRLGLVHHIRIGRTPAQRYDNETRLCLSRNGLTYLSRVDRSLLRDRQLKRKKKKPAGLLDQWLVEPDPGGDEAFELPEFLVRGSKAGVLLKERRHTDSVYSFIIMLVNACGGTPGWHIEQLLPAHRWERRFRHGRRAYSAYKDIWRVIKPDATIVLTRGGQQLSLFLESERRATEPSRMAPKIQTLRNYYVSADTVDDFADGRPDVLVVFEKREDASGFASYAARDGGPAIPMRVSSLEQLEADGIFGRSWLTPWQMDDGPISLNDLL